MRRSSFVRGVAALAAFTGPRAVPASAASAAAPSATLELGYLGKACDAPTLIAPGISAFGSVGHRVRLTRFAGDEQLVRAIGSGRVAAGSVTLAGLLRPFARGANVRVVAGLHAGCLRVVAPNAIEIGSYEDLRGKVIATDELGGPAMNLFSALLSKNGIDPRHGVTWRVYAPADLGDALDAKSVTCVAAADPLGYELVRAKKADPYLDAADGGFSCGGDIAHSHHCFLVVNADLVRSRPRAAAAITRGYLAAAAQLAKGIGPASVVEVRDGFVDTDMYAAVGMLSSYDWSASTDLVLEEIELTARDFRRSGLLDRQTDPQELAERAFADVLHA